MFSSNLFQDNIEVKKMYQLKTLVRKVCSAMNVTEEECHADSNDIVMIVTQIQKAGIFLSLSLSLSLHVFLSISSCLLDVCHDCVLEEIQT